VWILEPALIGEQRVVHLPEAPVPGGGLSRRSGRPGPWCLERTGKCRNATRTDCEESTRSVAAQNGHSKSE
jgi:hypothetical protein